MVQMAVKLPTYLQKKAMAMATDFEWAYISTLKKLSLCKRKHLD